MKRKRAGEPRDHRDVVLSVRVTSDEEQQLKAFAQSVDLPLGVLIRQSLKEILRRAQRQVGVKL